MHAGSQAISERRIATYPTKNGPSSPRVPDADLRGRSPAHPRPQRGLQRLDEVDRACRSFSADAAARLPSIGGRLPAGAQMPSRPQEFVALARVHAPFLRGRSIRLTSRQTVELLTETPPATRRNSRLSESRAKGRSSTSDASNLLACSSRLSFELGLPVPAAAPLPDVAGRTSTRTGCFLRRW